MDWGSGHIERNHEGPVIRADDARANDLTDNIHRFKELVAFKPVKRKTEMIPGNPTSEQPTPLAVVIRQTPMGPLKD